MNVRRITVSAIGIALFVVLSLCLQVPVFQNYYLCLGYFVMAVWLYSFGIMEGTIAGTFGVILYCVLTSGMRGMPGWTLGNCIIGIALGTVFVILKKKNNNGIPKPVTWTIYALTVIISVAVGILFTKSLTECILYSQPILVRMATNMPAAIADVITLLLALPLAINLDKLLHKHFPRLVDTR